MSAAVASQSPHAQQHYLSSPNARPARRPSQSQPGNNTHTTHNTNTNTASTSTPAAAPSASGPMPPPRTSSHRSAHSTAAAAAATTPRREDSRRAKESPRQQRPHPQHSRSASHVATSLPREESAVLARLGVSDPQDDVAREHARQAERIPASAAADLTPITGLALVGSEGVDDGGRGGGGGGGAAPPVKSRQDHSKSEGAKRTKFGNYILGQTLGEGEFGKVKMGWKRDSSVEVAIKLIRRETLGGNANRLQKIYREIHILRGLDHPNIVRLHEMVETERHIGIILEYASGGELFDYILNHRYLKDGPARKLFAQLISGVGYLHRKGIVHRDLKLENLLLDRNKNIIITDFGFANTFDPTDELSEDIEYRLGDKEYVRSLGLDGTDGARRGDLMQTSCGSPCYAAPELVVSDSLYTGCKVDVWSCGVILYAMLAGYLPFDDDPANPEGDNINLLYKYIVSTPLTFPEYVTPHARDLLKRILVPDPRKRADLFEVARHSWLADYSHVVGFITSSNTETQQSVYSNTFEQPPTLARSASVREPAKPHPNASTHGGLGAKRDPINQPSEKPKTTRENKRRTVQVEYVAPQSQTVRGEVSPPMSQEPIPKTRQAEPRPADIPPTDGHPSNARIAHSSGSATASRQRHEPQRSVSDYAAFGSPAPAVRPSTGGTLGGSRMPSRGNSYAQPAAATVAPTNAEGRFSQPKGKNYSISAPFTQPDNVGAGADAGAGMGMGMGEPSIGRPSTQRVQSSTMPPSVHATKGHKRSNTVTETLGRVTSMFTRQPSYSHDPKSSLTSQNSYANQPEERKKTYPPTSMAAPMSNEAISRQSVESSRRPSFSFSRKNNNPDAAAKSSRRFSLIPSSLSKTFSQRESMPAGGYDRRGSNAQRPRASSRSGMGFRNRDSRSPSQSTLESNVPAFYDGQHDSNSRIRAQPVPASAPPQQTQFDSPPFDDKFPNPRDPHPSQTQLQGASTNASANRPYRHPNESESQASAASEQHHGLTPTHSGRAAYPPGMSSSAESPHRKGVLQKSRKFADAYEDSGANKGSSGSSKKVMDFFRQMGRRRAGK